MKKKKIDKIQTWLRFRVKYLFISKIIYKKIFLRLLNKISKLFFGAREILGLYEENFFARFRTLGIDFKKTASLHNRRTLPYDSYDPINSKILTYL